MSEHNIQIQQRLTFDQLSRAVDEATREVGGTYGRKVMRGYLRLKGVRAGVNQIGAAQRRVAPFYADNRRRDLQRQVNPQTYRAPHYGYNLHFDQNEKLVDYGVVFVLANNRVERLWQEVNQRVGFPLKYAFIQLENAGYFHRWDPLHLRAASLLGCAVANVMLQRCIGAWNNHSIPGKGVPADYIPYSGTFPVPDDALPSVDRAVTMYRDKGGHLTDEHTFGVDPLENNVLLKAFRDQCFWFEIETTYKGLTELANNVANHNYMPFQYALLRFIQLTIHFFS
uniref:Uncharacterized protein n=1 Tax=Plectus sambesii TaxID=2011161 RepID=A0A914VGW3_9BILA